MDLGWRRKGTSPRAGGTGWERNLRVRDCSQVVDRELGLRLLKWFLFFFNLYFILDYS